jgi:cold shock CspA family protein
MYGHVKNYSELKGYGFIAGEDGNDYFVHFSNINMAGIRSLNTGEQVTFNPLKTPKGLQARSVESIKDPKKTRITIKPPTILKDNPFTPQDPITDPNKFAGRAEAMLNAVDLIFNNKNILVTGARGIGKSSVAYQLINLAGGDDTLIKRLNINTSGFVFNHITGDHRCLKGNTLPVIAKSLLDSIRFKYDANEHIKEVTSRWGCDLKIFSYSEETKYAEVTFNEIAMEFAFLTENLLHSIKDITTGICYLIDEVDELDKDVNLAPFLKSVVEKLRMDGYRNVSFILSGVTGIVTQLVSQHPSSSRLTENVNIEKMEADELGMIIDNCIKPTGTNITEAAKERIIGLSGSFPAPVHLLGYHAFKFDSDGEIDTNDVISAQYHIVQDIKVQDFQGRLDDFTGAEEKKILKLLSMPNSERLTPTDIAKRVSIPPDKVASILKDPFRLGTFVSKDGMYYEISEPLFRIYLRWVSGIQ